ncbi:MAG: SDR family NAD(P)-dependent oxidoreductase [Deltaproteobacteria bacterium]|nr:SDR family NAD(P)-dependent oxidoreductase [Deltaproteobacteria bacterium]
MKIAFLGASKGMGRALARQLASRGAQLFLLGRDLEDLGRSAADLQLHGASGTVGFCTCDLLQPPTFGPALDQASAAMNGLDTVIVTAGIFATQEELEADPALTARLLTADFTNTVLFCEEARKRLLAAGGGTLCVFSSVAGERGRKPVILYGAAKAGLSRYLEGLDHKFRSQGLRTITVKPGFVKTGMTAGLKPPPFAGEPDAVARSVARAIERGSAEVYAPGIWRLIMLVIRNLPRGVMRRIGF